MSVRARIDTLEVGDEEGSERSGSIREDGYGRRAVALGWTWWRWM